MNCKAAYQGYAAFSYVAVYLLHKPLGDFS